MSQMDLVLGESLCTGTNRSAVNATGTSATMTVEEAGRLLGISRGSAYRAANCGQIPTIRLGRRLLVPTARIHQILGLADADPGERPRDTDHTGIRLDGDGAEARLNGS
jgi:excisionase family DNA binding protein